MFTSKRRAELKKAANSLDCVVRMGKGGVNENMIKQIDDALEAHEIVKIKLLETSPVGAKEIAPELSAATRSETVQVIGRVVVLYRKNHKNPIY